MHMDDALKSMGVTRSAMPARGARELDRDGYTIFRSILSAEDVDRLRERLAALHTTEGDAAGGEVGREPGAARLSDLVNKGAVFDICFSHPTLLSSVAHVLGEFKLSSLSSRAALPGLGAQALHTDWPRQGRPATGYRACNSMWLLDDFVPDNGATRVVPGSHRWNASPAEQLENSAAAHPHEVLILGKAGDLAIFNADLWHGGTQNKSPAPRRAVHAYFCAREHAQQLSQSAYIQPTTVKRLDAAQRFLLDV